MLFLTRRTPGSSRLMKPASLKIRQRGPWRPSRVFRYKRRCRFPLLWALNPEGFTRRAVLFGWFGNPAPVGTEGMIKTRRAGSPKGKSLCLSQAPAVIYKSNLITWHLRWCNTQPVRSAQQDQSYNLPLLKKGEQMSSSLPLPNSFSFLLKRFRWK